MSDAVYWIYYVLRLWEMLKSILNGATYYRCKVWIFGGEAIKEKRLLDCLTSSHLNVFKGHAMIYSLIYKCSKQVSVKLLLKCSNFFEILPGGELTSRQTRPSVGGRFHVPDYWTCG